MLLKEKIVLKDLNEKLKKELNEEVLKRKVLENEVAETTKRRMMLNSDTNDLNNILMTLGMTEKSNHGLGYQGGITTCMTKFVKGNNTEVVPTNSQKIKIERRNPYGCYYCGKNGHIKRYCYKFEAKVKRLINQQRYYAYYNDSSCVWVKKSDFYQKQVVAYTSMSSVEIQSWYFDSGCSRHMIGNQKALGDYTKVK